MHKHDSFTTHTYHKIILQLLKCLQMPMDNGGGAQLNLHMLIEEELNLPKTLVTQHLHIVPRADNVL